MLVTVEYIKKYLGITNSTDDGMIQAALRGRSEDFERWESATRTEYHNGDGTQVLLTDYYPISSITTIHDDIDRVYGSSTLIDSDDYCFDGEAGVVMLDAGCFFKGNKNIKIVYVSGYESDEIPEDLKLALAQLVIADYLELKGGVNAFEGDTLTYKPANFRKQAQAIIDKHLHIR